MICSRVFAVAGLLHGFLLALFTLSLMVSPLNGAFWIQPMPSAQGSLWVNLESNLEYYPLLFSMLIGWICYVGLLFLLGLNTGAYIWKHSGAFHTISMLSFLIASIGTGLVSILSYEWMAYEKSVYEPNPFNFLLIVFFVLLPSILTALIAGRITKLKMQDFVQKNCEEWLL